MELIINITGVILTLVGTWITYQQLKLIRLPKKKPLKSSLILNDKNSTFDANRKNYLVELSNKSGMRTPITDYLADEIHKRKDPSERYWIYVTLGEIGGKEARKIIKKGLSDDNEFARTGAETVWPKMKSLWGLFGTFLGGSISILSFGFFVAILWLIQINDPGTSSYLLRLLKT